MSLPPELLGLSPFQCLCRGLWRLLFSLTSGAPTGGNRCGIASVKGMNFNGREQTNDFTNGLSADLSFLTIPCFLPPVWASLIFFYDSPPCWAAQDPQQATSTPTRREGKEKREPSTGPFTLLPASRTLPFWCYLTSSWGRVPYAFKALPHSLSLYSEFAFRAMSSGLKMNMLLWQRFHFDYIAFS